MPTRTAPSTSRSVSSAPSWPRSSPSRGSPCCGESPVPPRPSRRRPRRKRSPRRPSPQHPPTDPESDRLRDLYRGGFGIALIGGAALIVLSRAGALDTLGDAALTAVVVVVAVGLILAPFLWRLGRNLAMERAERIRSQERAELAAHLHDSVLQTLTLMQKRAGDPREVAALARRQERELREWLGGDGRARPRRALPRPSTRRCGVGRGRPPRRDRGRGGRRLRVGRARGRRAGRGPRGAAERGQARRRGGTDPCLRGGR